MGKKRSLSRKKNQRSEDNEIELCVAITIENKLIPCR